LELDLLKLRKVTNNNIKRRRFLIMALNDTFKILPKNKISLKADLSSLLTNKDYWAEECKEHPSKKECLFYCD
jgi:hypothetical protein